MDDLPSFLTDQTGQIVEAWFFRVRCFSPQNLGILASNNSIEAFCGSPLHSSAKSINRDTKMSWRIKEIGKPSTSCTQHDGVNMGKMKKWEEPTTASWLRTNSNDITKNMLQHVASCTASIEPVPSRTSGNSVCLLTAGDLAQKSGSIQRGGGRPGLG